MPGAPSAPYLRGRVHVNRDLTVSDSSWATALCRELEAVPGLVERTSRFGPAGRVEWRVGRLEVARLPALPFVDIRLPSAVRKAVVGDARFVPRAGRSDWVECRMETPEDAVFVATLIRPAAQRPSTLGRR